MKDSNFFITKLLVGETIKADDDKKAARLSSLWYQQVLVLTSDSRDKMLVN